MSYEGNDSHNLQHGGKWAVKFKLRESESHGRKSHKMTPLFTRENLKDNPCHESKSLKDGRPSNNTEAHCYTASHFTSMYLLCVLASL